MFLLYASALMLGFSGAMMPGPMLTYTIRQSLARGPRVGWIVTLGHMTLELILVALIFLGFGRIMQMPAAQIAISLAGGILLAYMGIDMVAGAVRNTVRVCTEAEGGSSDRGMFLSGALISAANPYFLIWWAVIGLGFLTQSNAAYGLAGVLVWYFGHCSADFIWYGFISNLVGRTRRFIRQTPYRIIIALLGCLLVYFGSSFIAAGVTKLR